MMGISRCLLVLSLVSTCATAASLDAFLPPLNSTQASGGELGTSVVSSAEACASACLSNASCISFNLLPLAPVATCGILGECYAPNATSCPAVMTLSCPGGVFTNLTFASYGTPVTLPGTCAWATGACSAPSAADVVAAACIGQQECFINVEARTFGVDPCPGVYKFLAVALQGNCSSSPPPVGSSLCMLNGYSRVYTVTSNLTYPALYYLKLQPRNDSRFTQVVPWQLTVPTSNVTLHPGVLLNATEVNVLYLLNNFPVDDLLFNFRARAGQPQAPGAKCIGWDCHVDWVEGSLASLFMMGAGNYLRWTENGPLRRALTTLIDGIDNCSLPDGFIMAFDPVTMATDEHPDYTLSWMTHGLIDAHIAGNPKALRLLRGMMSWFNNHTLIPTFLPPDGGSPAWVSPTYQTPLGPSAPTYVANVSSGTGTETGHTVYLIYQGIIHNTQMALTELGTQADVDLVINLYQEQWWLDWFLSGDVQAVSSRLWFWHNYEVTAYEAYLDMYVLTGKQLYLDAMLNAWSLFRTYYLHVGGSVAINERNFYEPGSYYLTADFPRENAKRDHMRLLRMVHAHGHAYAAANWMSLAEGHHRDMGHVVDAHVNGDWGNHPTGEMCGAVFWLKFNQRFHRLFPLNETFVGEMETEIFNEALTHQGADGVGIRYFSNLNGQKELPSAIGTCCEGQGTRLLGSLHEYLYSIAPDGVFVDIYAPSTFMTVIEGALVNVTTATQFPYTPSVIIYITAAATVNMTLYLRMPAWVTPPQVAIFVDSAAAAVGTAGSYVKLPLSVSPSTVVVSYVLPMTFTAHLYTGVTQIEGYTRYAYTYGPILLGFQGEWNESLNCIGLRGVDPNQPVTFMVPAGDGNSLHWNVTGTSVTVVPAYEIQEANANFTAYPAFQ